MNNKIDSVLNLYAFLQEIANKPLKHQEVSTQSFLRSQGALAKYNSADKKIRSCSLNTLKGRANEYLLGGFDELDRVRSAALKAISKPALIPAKPQSRPHLKNQVLILKSEIQKLNEELFYYTVALQKCMEQSRFFAKQTNDLVNIKLCEKQHAELYASLKHPRTSLNA
jgi:transposase